LSQALVLALSLSLFVVKRRPAKRGTQKIIQWKRNTKMMNKGMKALKKEAPEVAKKMGYSYGGMSKKKKPMGYNKGGMCGASMPPARPVKKA
tara:strand:+ start:12 stop:287 length:276 start_codon:yes stop_codon:yes gene_type:complete